MSQLSTDWDRYYATPFPLAHLTRWFTCRKLLRAIREFSPAPPEGICEVGGGGSVFFQKLTHAFPLASYFVLDSNQNGLDRLVEKHPGHPRLHFSRGDILAGDRHQGYDLVFSVGLIEHFSESDTALAVQNHFALTKPGGLVLLLFPTPSPLYWSVRHSAERLGVWRFPDERPLPVEEVQAAVRAHGKVLATRFHAMTVLTQAMVIARKG